MRLLLAGRRLIFVPTAVIEARVVGVGHSIGPSSPEPAAANDRFPEANAKCLLGPRIRYIEYV